jgi:ribonucleoside-diphosphate reductase alpha chain
VEEIEKAYIEGWRLGLKAVAIYRDGSKRTQPDEHQFIRKEIWRGAGLEGKNEGTVSRFAGTAGGTTFHYA